MTENELDVAPLVSTPRGLPYPLATDPVAQGAAAIEALARAVDVQIGATLYVGKITAFSAPSGAQVNVIFDYEWQDDWNGFTAPSTELYAVAAGTYVLLGNVNSGTGATGDGSCAASFQVINAAGDSALDTPVSTEVPGVNQNLSMAGMAQLAAGQRVRMLLEYNATGSGHTIAVARAALIRVR